MDEFIGGIGGMVVLFILRACLVVYLKRRGKSAKDIALIVTAMWGRRPKT